MKTATFKPLPAVPTAARRSTVGARPCRVGVRKGTFAVPNPPKMVLRSTALRAMEEVIPQGPVEPGFEWDKVKVGDRECYVYKPKDIPVEALVVFLSGFAQTPQQYKMVLTTCASKGVAIIAPDSTTYDSSRSELQERLVEEGEFWLNEVLGGKNEKLKSLLPGDIPQFGVLGHSLGGGLTFKLASLFPQIQRIVAMSPFPSLSDGYDPAVVIRGDAFSSGKREVKIYTGGLDFYARTSEIKSNIVEALSETMDEEGYRRANILLGAHTIYQDNLNIPVREIVEGILPFRDEKKDGSIFEVFINEIPGLLTGRLQFFQGTIFEIGALVLALGYGTITDKDWLQYLSGGLLAILTVGLLFGQLSKAISGEPKKLASDIADFFLYGHPGSKEL